MLLDTESAPADASFACFNGHPPLGVNATLVDWPSRSGGYSRFNGHPPLGVNATDTEANTNADTNNEFQWAPTLGGECYEIDWDAVRAYQALVSMGTHPWG